MDKRYQIFISSTFKDLEEERKQVMQAVLNRKCFPAGMELFPAVDIEQFDYIKKVIDDSDYYLLIIGARYGSLDENGFSFTEKEYDYAVSREIPVIAFIHNNIKLIPLGKADTDPELQKKLEAFRAKVQQGRLVNYWKDASDLRIKVTESLITAFQEIPRTGWVRANEANADSSQEVKSLRRQIKQLQEQKSSATIDKYEYVHNWNQKIKMKVTINYEIAHEYHTYSDRITINPNIKKWFKTLRDIISRSGLGLSDYSIQDDLERIYAKDPFIKQKLFEEVKRSILNKKTFQITTIDISSLSESDLVIRDINIEPNDLLIILATLDEQGVLQKNPYSDRWEITEKGERKYKELF